MRTRTYRLEVIGALALVLWASTAAGAESGDPASAYLELLQQYANGQEDEALRRLIGLQWSLEGDELERARQAQLELVAALRPLDSRVIPPLVSLHERAYLAYRAEGATARAAHARTTMLLLCELMADRLLSPAQKRLAGGLFASLAGYSQETSTGPLAMTLFQRALALDPGNEAALLGLATDLERHGRFAKALPFLERLSRSYPQNAEARLRLAINLDRAGQQARAMPLLRELLKSDPPPWILSLAHQALARMLLDEGELEEARTVLTHGLAGDPEDSALAVALAYATERLAADSAEIELSAFSVPIDPSAGRPPRFRYARYPAEAFARLRTRLRRASRAQRWVLAEALAERSAREAD